MRCKHCGAELDITNGSIVVCPECKKLNIVSEATEQNETSSVTTEEDVAQNSTENSTEQEVLSITGRPHEIFKLLSDKFGIDIFSEAEKIRLTELAQQYLNESEEKNRFILAIEDNIASDLYNLRDYNISMVESKCNALKKYFQNANNLDMETADYIIDSLAYAIGLISSVNGYENIQDVTVPSSVTNNATMPQDNEVSTTVQTTPVPSSQVSENRQDLPVPKKKKSNILIIIIFILVVILLAAIGYKYFSGKNTDEIADETEVITIDNNVADPNVNVIEVETLDAVIEDVENNSDNTDEVVAINDDVEEEVVEVAPINKEKETEQPKVSETKKVEKQQQQEKIQPPSGPQYKTINYPSGEKYEGYVNSLEQKHGKGTYTWRSGNKYVGDWDKDRATGYGTYYSHEGWRYEGQFHNAEFHGKGTYYFANGKKKEGRWVYGKMQ
ncbi:hypothetical protein D0T53_03720 [Dysgonomonas sp. 216]|uniref:MORN repeat-containing protein n=1 Tax=Dysgonomonas sp. 216 TaxID=2302934 RepID=UPI0013D4B2D7|nr:hypothetical protein [Dysgonomonas sp. 216]NDW18024.1 hypothetical protein [Dysgonomonas sp. 216]